MTSRNMSNAIRVYSRSISETYSTGYATEHSYRSALQMLIEAFGGDGTRALNEPSHVECGAPDFIVELKGVPIGHVECKDVGTDLEQVGESPQLERYREGLPNLILTDYLEFHWYIEGFLRESARLGSLNRRGEFILDYSGTKRVAALLGSFLTADTPFIGNSRDLAKRMAAKARLLYDGVTRILVQEGVERGLCTTC